MNYINQFINFLKDIYRSRDIVLELTKKEIKQRYLGSYLGMLWAFIQPAVNILIIWFVFQFGFKSAPIRNFPYILWLVCGMIPWIFLSEAILSGATSVIDNSYLVKKVVFRVSILPIIKILSSLFIHIFFTVIIFIMFKLYGFSLNVYNLEVIYYMAASVVLVLGISFITSSIIIFLKDIGPIVAMILQFGFWLTPVFWSFDILPEKYKMFFKLNPAYYIIEGYRDAFIYHNGFWQSPRLMLYFWSVTLFIFIAGALIFKRLRPHFADVL